MQYQTKISNNRRVRIIRNSKPYIRNQSIRNIQNILNITPTQNTNNPFTYQFFNGSNFF